MVWYDMGMIIWYYMLWFRFPWIVLRFGLLWFGLVRSSFPPSRSFPPPGPPLQVHLYVCDGVGGASLVAEE